MRKLHLRVKTHQIKSDQSEKQHFYHFGHFSSYINYLLIESSPKATQLDFNNSTLVSYLSLGTSLITVTVYHPVTQYVYFVFTIWIVSSLSPYLKCHLIQAGQGKYVFVEMIPDPYFPRNDSSENFHSNQRQIENVVWQWCWLIIPYNK